MRGPHGLLLLLLAGDLARLRPGGGGEARLLAGRRDGRDRGLRSDGQQQAAGGRLLTAAELLLNC